MLNLTRTAPRLLTEFRLLLTAPVHYPRPLSTYQAREVIVPAGQWWKPGGTEEEQGAPGHARGRARAAHAWNTECHPPPGVRLHATCAHVGHKHR